jgi:hypothetical protein
MSSADDRLRPLLGELDEAYDLKMIRGRATTVVAGAIALAAVASVETPTASSSGGAAGFRGAGAIDSGTNSGRAGAAGRAVFAVELEGSVATTYTVPEREAGSCRYFGYSVTHPLHFWSERSARVVIRRGVRPERATLYGGTLLRPVRAWARGGAVPMEGICANGQRISGHGDFFGHRRTTAVRFFRPAKGRLALSEVVQPGGRSAMLDLGSTWGRIDEARFFNRRNRTITVSGASVREEPSGSIVGGTISTRISWTLTFRRLRG